MRFFAQRVFKPSIQQENKALLQRLSLYTDIEEPTTERNHEMEADDYET